MNLRHAAFAAASVFSVALHAQAPPAHRSVLMISVDGMRPDYVTEADKHGLKVPVMRGFLTEGTYASSVLNVTPTMTYPNHTTMVTGVWPSEHGVANNTVFDPLGKEQGAWNWFAQIVKVPTLWQAAKASGMTTASLFWPVTVHAQGIDYNIPEFFHQKTSQDQYLVEAAAYPVGLLEEMEKTTGPFLMGKSDIAEDEKLTQIAVKMIETRKPELMTIHLVSLDHVEHGKGPFSPIANDRMEKLDGMVGRIMDAMRKVHPEADIVVVSDHGFLPITHRVNLNGAFAEAGLITVAQAPSEHASAWKAMVWTSGGSAMVMLKDKKDAATTQKVADLLAKLAADPANGIAAVYRKGDAAIAGATPDAAFIVDFKSGYSVGAKMTGKLVEDIPEAGTHGYVATMHPELHSSFFIKGPEIARGKNLGEVDMRQIAPTLAREMNISLPSATMAPMPVQR